ncbi:MAG TPA: nucleoside diphosphate kinase regulator, partial [Fontimonas sp.]
RGIATAALRSEPEVAEQLLAELERADLVPAEAMPANVVALGRWVTYQDVQSGSIRTIQLVMPGDADPAAQKVSIVSPIGAALIGLSVGQVMRWQLREGQTRRLTVINVADDPAQGR